jgi:hypothetical protein
VVKAYNDASNDAGEDTRSHRYTEENEGIDLKSVKHVHVFDPLMSYTADIRSGRAIRMCSHGRLDFEKDWNVTIHRYFSKPRCVDRTRCVQRHSRRVETIPIGDEPGTRSSERKR